MLRLSEEEAAAVAERQVGRFFAQEPEPGRQDGGE